jgi:cardiolipin synthase A/B
VKPAPGWQSVSELALSLGADPLLPDNRVDLYHEGQLAYDAMLTDIAKAQHHVHMEMFIFRYDEIGQQFVEALTERAKAGVQVRFLYDAVGSWRLRRKLFEALCAAGGCAEPFLPVQPLRRRLQINLRNHRKILIIDGKVGFTGGLNIGGEYVGRNPFFGPWRDTFLRLEGPSVSSMQRIFLEDWDFSTSDTRRDPGLFPPAPDAGDAEVQVIWSGPDQELKLIREVYFAAITRARSRIWIASPYFVPDAGLLDALCLAARSGVDVRLLCPFRPDKWVAFLAARFYWADLFGAGIKIYQYTAGFMHAKVLLVDDEWASVGTANFDHRSLRLNFELTCVIESKEVIHGLIEQFVKDFAVSIRVNPGQFAARPFVSRVAENAARLASPLL